MQLLSFFIISTLVVLFAVAQEAPSEFIVTMRNFGTLSTETEIVKAQLIQRFGASVKKVISIGELRFFVTATSAENALKIGQEIPEVLYVAPNSVVKAKLQSIEKKYVTTEESTEILSSRDGSTTESGDFCYEQQSGDALWGLTRIVRREPWNPDDNNTPQDDVYTYSSLDDGHGVDIFIVGTGIMTQHNDFNGRAVTEYTVPDLLAGEGSNDQSGTGTFAAGIAGATTYGVAKNATLRSVKVLDGNGGGSLGWILEGLAYIQETYMAKRTSTGKRPPWVINVSLGAPFNQALNDAVKGMVQAGIIMVLSAGGSAGDACMQSPTAVTEAIVVGATDDQDRLTSTSNYGPCVDVLAPGESIRSTFIPLPTSVVEGSGTGTSAAFVAGVIARYIQGMDEPPLPAQVEAWLTDTATEGVVDVNIGSSFPNITTDRLLYKECTPGPEYPPPTLPPPAENAATTFGHRPMSVTAFVMAIITIGFQ